MKNLLIITQKVDINDDLLGFFIDWIKEFSKHFEKVSVITLFKGEYNLPDNVRVYSLGKENGASKIRQFFTFYFLFFALKYDSVFAHMSPIFAVAAWPAAFVFRKRVILWYLHRSVTWRLKLAEKVSFKIVTSTKDSLNIKSGKIVETGHGINTDRFKAERQWNSGIFNVLSVGRISPIKGYETLIDAAGFLRDNKLSFSVKIVGRPIMKSDYKYDAELKEKTEKAGLSDIVEFSGFVPYSSMPEYYRKADIVVNLAPTGGIDKAVLEAMSSGCLVLTSNTAFGKYFGELNTDLIFKHGDPDDLAGKIKSLALLDVEKKNKISNFLVQVVKERHSMKKTIMSISEILKK